MTGKPRLLPAIRIRKVRIIAKAGTLHPLLWQQAMLRGAFENIADVEDGFFDTSTHAFLSRESAMTRAVELFGLTDDEQRKISEACGADPDEPRLLETESFEHVMETRTTAP